MKLKDYLSRKRLKRRNSKVSAFPLDTELDSKISCSFIDYDTEPRTIYAKDDCHLQGVRITNVRMRDKSGNKVESRSAMTQSLITNISCSFEQNVPTNNSSSQTSKRSALSCKIDYDFNPRLSVNSEETRDIETEQDGEMLSPSHTCSREISDCNDCCSCYNKSIFNSLPSSQTHSQNLMSDVHYNSLPLSMTQSCYIESGTSVTEETMQESKQKYMERCRSRIRTNPWLPLPKTNCDIQWRDKSDKRREPRLSRFISEVEEIMREQCGITDTTAETPKQALSGSFESIASTCSTATEIPEKLTEISPMRSPSEGYKSACGSEFNLADTESYNADDIIDSLSSSCADIESHKNLKSSTQCPPTYKDFTLYNEQSSSNLSTSINASMSESMFTSTLSLKSEALQQRVKKLCLSTTELDEKMRLARLESSYIRVK